jgi:hypothetical protein
MRIVTETDPKTHINIYRGDITLRILLYIQIKIQTVTIY